MNVAETEKGSPPESSLGDRVDPRDPKIMGEDHEFLDPDNLASYEIDPAETRRLLRKLDWHIAPVCMILYLIAFLDRANIGTYHTNDAPPIGKAITRPAITEHSG